MARRYCKCGKYFDIGWQVVEHIGICNPHWPRTSESDEHIEITKEEYWKKHSAQAES